ncbi:MAG TPA: hypothetical protein VJG29_00460, partial [Candidatus Paceibacterota bacterium]
MYTKRVSSSDQLSTHAPTANGGTNAQDDDQGPAERGLPECVISIGKLRLHRPRRARSPTPLSAPART